jgi:hypothetical protein
MVRRVADHGGQGRSSWLYHPTLVHGLFQTPEYAATLLRSDPGLVDARMARQAVFTRPDPPSVVCVLPELALHHNIGGPDVMAPQLDRLIEAPSSPRVVVQVVPNGQIIRGHDGELVIATLEMGVEVGYVETPARGMILDAHRDIAQMKERFSDIRAHALPMEMSLDLIRRTKEQLWTT